MRVLVIHPEDDLQAEPWASLRWDRVIDLGRAGAQAYAHAAARFGCAVTSLSEFREEFKEMRRVRELLTLGMGRLNDRFGLDWWELTAIIVHQQLELAFVLGELVATLGPQDEVYVSQPGFHADVLRLALGSRLRTFSARGGRKGGARHYLRVLKKFPLPQLFEIFWDKTDAGYQVRGWFNRKRKPSTDAVVLLPSAYINVSNTGVAYAQSLPDTHFLLVVTRRSGWVENAPANVSATWLRRYASLRAPSRKLELLDLEERWDALRRELLAVPEVRTLAELGWLDEFPARFAQGLEIRDAWRNVLDFEPVKAIICADDHNPYTHIPVLLAKARGLPAIVCHHGALDGRYMFKRNHADVLLARGRMEADYLVRMCGVPAERVEIGAPFLTTDANQPSGRGDRPFIVFFSEAYEVAGGRGHDFYEDILPSLADLALSEGRELIIKLHPSESFSERSRFVEQILTPEQRRITRLMGGPLQPELLDRTWFGVTVMSTVVVECMLHGIPCFLCVWLESWPYGYDDQFARFEAGIRLHEPKEIKSIPDKLSGYKVSTRVRENCWRSIEPERFRALLGMGPANSAAIAAQSHTG
jgi:hypothetical protein